MLDSLLGETPLPHRGRFNPIGFPLHVVSNSMLALRAAEESWRKFRPMFQEPALEIRVLVRGHGSRHREQEPVYGIQEYLLEIVADRDNFAACDLESGFGFCCVTHEVITDQAYFRWFYLEALVYCIITYRYVTPVHAACVALEGSGVLLCGKSGSGKSCLALACAQHGWEFLSDDCTSILRKGPRQRALGRPFHARFRPEAAALFPELRDLEPFTAPNGKPSIELNVADSRNITTALNCRIDHIIFLERLDCTEPHLQKITPEEALRRLEQDIPLFRRSVTEDHRRNLRELVEADLHLLRYGDLDSAVSALEGVVRKAVSV